METWGPDEWVILIRGTLAELATRGVLFTFAVALGVTLIRHGWPWQRGRR